MIDVLSYELRIVCLYFLEDIVDKLLVIAPCLLELL